MKVRDAEKTKQHILAIAQKLFFTYGYDQTTMSDIMKEGNLTKGAIYYHFKSKREIFDVIMIQLDNQGKKIEQIITDETSSVIEKLKLLIEINLTNEKKGKVLAKAKSLFSDDKVYGEMVRENKKFTPVIADLIKNESDALDIKFPDELAEQFIQFFNIWMGMELYDISQEKFEQKITFYTKLFADNGLPIIDANMRALFLKYFAYFK